VILSDGHSNNYMIMLHRCS